MLQQSYVEGHLIDDWSDWKEFISWDVRVASESAFVLDICLHFFFLFTSYEGQIQSLFLAKAMLVVEISSKAIHAETCLLSQSVECVTWNHGQQLWAQARASLETGSSEEL